MGRREKIVTYETRKLIKISRKKRFAEDDSSI